MQARDDAVIVGDLPGELAGLRNEWDARLVRARWVLELERQDANDRVHRPVEADLSTNDGTVGGKAAAPQGITQEDDALVARLILLGREGAADRRRHAQDRE